MKLEDREADAIERRFGRGKLLQNLDAQAGFLHHPPDAAHLPFDPIQARDDRLLLGFVEHGLTQHNESARGRGPRRRRDGRADRRALRQRRPARPAARRHAATPRATGSSAPPPEAGSVLHAGLGRARPTGGFDEDLASIAGGRLDRRGDRRAARRQAGAARARRRLRRADAIVSSNTSGIPLAAIAEGRSDGFRRHWLGTHFFNPPRYLHLLELIPTAETDPAVVRD